MRIRIDGVTYQAEAITKLSILDVLKFDQWAQDSGFSVRWIDVEDILNELHQLPKQERRRHPGALWMLALTIWSAKKAAGEDLTFGDALDSVPALDSSRVQYLDDPQDRKAAEAQGPHRAGSGQGAAAPRVEAAHGTRSRKKSKRKSAGA